MNEKGNQRGGKEKNQSLYGGGEAELKAATKGSAVLVFQIPVDIVIK